MSGAIAAGAAASGYGLLGVIVGDSERAKQQLDTLTVQAGDGLVSDSFSGLGAGAGTALDLQPAVAHTQALQTGISAATGTMGVAQTALTEISSIASNFYAQTNNENGLEPATVDSIAASARDALSQVASLLDTRDGNSYVFAGQDSANAPVPNPGGINASGFATQIQAAVAGLSTTGAAPVIAATLATASSNAGGTSPFSAALSQPASALRSARTTVQADDGLRLPTGIVASANGDVVSTGGSTTGSYMRDIMRALATLGALSSGQVSTTGFSDVVADARTSLGGAISALNEDAGVMGNRQTELTAIGSRLAATQTALTTQLSGITQVDMAKTLSNLSAAQTRLQASYQLISGVQSLSLVKYMTSTG